VVIQAFYPAQTSVSVDKYEARNPLLHIASTVGNKCKKTETNRQFATKKTEKEKQYNEQPTHKTAHLQAPTHKPMLQLAKEFALAYAPQPTHHPDTIRVDFKRKTGRQRY
jgi:hypothetical protein